jgi:hypothetical protein
VKTFLKIVWWTSLGVLQLAIIAFVFDHLQTRLESIVVAILGLIYVTIRSIAINQGIAFTKVAASFASELARIEEWLGENSEFLRERRVEIAQAEQTIYGPRIIITSIFLSIVSLYCLVVLFGAVVGDLLPLNAPVFG